MRQDPRSRSTQAASGLCRQSLWAAAPCSSSPLLQPGSALPRNGCLWPGTVSVARCAWMVACVRGLLWILCFAV
eukprot:3379765-Rhodomonas_salina.1